MEYELTLVLPEKTTPAKKKAVNGFVEKLVTTFKGKIIKGEDWGKIDLATTIKGNSSGNFLHFVLELEPGHSKDLETKIRMEEGIVRYLLVRKEKGGKKS